MKGPWCSFIIHGEKVGVERTLLVTAVSLGMVPTVIAGCSTANKNEVQYKLTIDDDRWQSSVAVDRVPPSTLSVSVSLS